MLKDDLFAAIAYCTSEGLATRVVSNGYWGKTANTAHRTAAELRSSGLQELNISTGKDHQEWVPSSSIINAATAAAEAGIFCLVTVENQGEDLSLINEILKSPILSPYIESRAISVQSNSWMPFHEDAERRQQKVDIEQLRVGCNQIFDTVVVTPHDNLSACCGLTLEHIPEMRLGKNDGYNIEALYSSQFDDFMKMWIHVDGPYSIIERVMGKNSFAELENVVHICEACSIMHKNPEIRNAIRERYQEFIPEVMTRLKVSMALRERSLNLSRSA